MVDTRPASRYPSRMGGSIMRNFFWPTQLNPTPGVIARIGRVIHWLGTVYLVIACLWATLILAVLGYQIATSQPPRSSWWSLDQPAFAQTAAAPATAAPDPVSHGLGSALAILSIAFIVYLATRALRYVLSGE